MAAQHGHHIIPKKILYRVFFVLVFLTILTAVTAVMMELGPLEVPVALGIAGTKALLVVTFFMALKYDRKVNSLVFALGFVFVLVFIVFTLFDTAFRGDVGNVFPETIYDMDRRQELLLERESLIEGMVDEPVEDAAAPDAAEEVAPPPDAAPDPAATPGEEAGEEAAP